LLTHSKTKQQAAVIFLTQTDISIHLVKHKTFHYLPSEIQLAETMMHHLYMFIILSAISLCVDSYSLYGNRLFKCRGDVALLAKKAGRRQISDGMKLGKGFGSPGSSLDLGETEEKEVPNPMVYSEANSLNQGASSSDMLSSLTKPTNVAIGELPDADAVFKKYGIGKGQSDRFGNEVTPPKSAGSKRTLKPGETRAFGECKKRTITP
jgi:hypothetical protein